MECPNCRFQNMPGLVSCGRCGTSLQLASAVIDVHPPRARPWVKRLRRWFPLLSQFSQVRRWGSEAVVGLAQFAGYRRLTLSLMARTIVPGWPQIHEGRTRQGWTMLAAYLVMLPLGLLFWGTFSSGLLLGAAVSIHLATITGILIFRESGEGAPVRWSVFCAMVICAALYLPGLAMLYQVADPLQYQANAFPFEAGDVVLCNQLAYWWVEPAPGDVVEFYVPYTQVAQYRLEPGPRIDRILSGPGHTWEVREGKFWLDGQPARWLPLDPGVFNQPLAITVPAGYYLVLPTADTNALMHPPNMWRQIGLVPRQHILGRAYLRSQPFSRWWWIN